MSYPAYPSGPPGPSYPGYPTQPGYPSAPPASSSPGYPTGPPAPGAGYPPSPGYPATTAAPSAPYPSAPAPAGYPPAPGASGTYPPPNPGYPEGGSAPYPGAAPGGYPPAGPTTSASHSLGFAGAAMVMSAFPHPARTTYPGAPPTSAPYPSGPPAAGAPYPGGPPGGAPYPGAPASASAPYPSAPGAAPGDASAPYPSAPGVTPGGAPAPYPSAPGAAPGGAPAPYPSAPGAAPGGAPAPYPSAPGAAPAPMAYPSGPPIPTAQPIPRAQPVSAHPPTDAMARMSVRAPKRQTHGTITPAANFDKEEDAKRLKKAMQGFGCDEKTVISIVSHRSNKQRQEIRQVFKTMYGKDLMQELRSELSGHLRDVILSAMMLPEEYDASQLYHAMKGIGTTESVLIEILCSRSNAEIRTIKERFRRDFSKDLEREVKSETSGHFERLLVSMLVANRDESETVDQTKAQKDAQALYKAGEARWGTDEGTFNFIFASRSFPQLRATFDEYSRICKYDIERSVEREMSGDLKNGMVALVKLVRDMPGFFAERLYKSMKGLGTDDSTLVRCVVTRSEVDMVEVKQRFQQMYKKSLKEFIEGDTSGNYRRCLLSMIGEGTY